MTTLGEYHILTILSSAILAQDIFHLGLAESILRGYAYQYLTAVQQFCTRMHCALGLCAGCSILRYAHRLYY